MNSELRVHFPTNRYERPEKHFGSMFGPAGATVPREHLAAMREVFTRTGRDLYLWSHQPGTRDKFGWVKDTGEADAVYPACTLDIAEFTEEVKRVYHAHGQPPNAKGSPFNVRSMRKLNDGARAWKIVTDWQVGKRWYACMDFDLPLVTRRLVVEDKPSYAEMLLRGVVSGLLDALQRTLGYAGFDLRIVVGSELWELDNGVPRRTAEVYIPVSAEGSQGQLGMDLG